MEIERELEHLAAPFLGTFDPSRLLPPFDQLLFEQLDNATAMIDGMRPMMSEPFRSRPFKAAITNSRLIGARAVAGTHSDYILINLGVIERLYGTISGLLASPTFLPSAGDPSGEVPLPAPFPSGLPKFPLLDGTEAEDRLIYFIRPNDKIRGALALLLAYHSIDFLVAHEVGHILGGHLELARDLWGRRFIAEFDQSDHNPALTPPLAVLECDADMFAAHRTSFTQLHPAMEKVWAADNHWPSLSAMEAMVASYATGIAVLFRLVDSGEHPSGSIRASSHAHPAVRSSMAISWGLTLASTAGRFSLDALPDLLARSVQAVEREWTSLGLPGQRAGSPEDWEARVGSESTQLERAHANAIPLMTQYARVPQVWHGNWPPLKRLPKDP